VIGISTAIIPVYINSIAPPSIVGKLGSFNQLLQTVGVVIAYVGGSIIQS
jgi:SP family galactose:H+ symporter-like MFS transporter